MINAKTVKLLNLKPYTMNACKGMYVKLAREYGSNEAIFEVLTWWRDQAEKLNEAWWVLNYHSEELDEDRRMRALIESMLDRLADEAEQKLVIEID